MCPLSSLTPGFPHRFSVCSWEFSAAPAERVLWKEDFRQKKSENLPTSKRFVQIEWAAVNVVGWVCSRDPQKQTRAWLKFFKKYFLVSPAAASHKHSLSGAASREEWKCVSISVGTGFAAHIYCICRMPSTCKLRRRYWDYFYKRLIDRLKLIISTQYF